MRHRLVSTLFSSPSLSSFLLAVLAFFAVAAFYQLGRKVGGGGYDDDSGGGGRGGGGGEDDPSLEDTYRRRERSEGGPKRPGSSESLFPCPHSMFHEQRQVLEVMQVALS